MAMASLGGMEMWCGRVSLSPFIDLRNCSRGQWGEADMLMRKNGHAWWGGGSQQAQRVAGGLVGCFGAVGESAYLHHLGQRVVVVATCSEQQAAVMKGEL
jgi:hypothetical protein